VPVKSLTRLSSWTVRVGDIVYQWEAFVLILIECCSAAIEIWRSPQLINVLSDTERVCSHPEIRESDARPLVGSWNFEIMSYDFHSWNWVPWRCSPESSNPWIQPHCLFFFFKISVKFVSNRGSTI